MQFLSGGHDQMIHSRAGGETHSSVARVVQHTMYFVHVPCEVTFYVYSHSQLGLTLMLLSYVVYCTCSCLSLAVEVTLNALGCNTMMFSYTLNPLANGGNEATPSSFEVN